MEPAGMTAKTPAERKAAERARKLEADLTEVRGVFASKHHHAAIRQAARDKARELQGKKERVMGKRVTMLVEVEVDELAFDAEDQSSVDWFANDVLMNNTEDGALYLHSNEVGDTVGRVRVLIIKDWPPSAATHPKD
jgi:acetylglutamate kinase